MQHYSETRCEETPWPAIPKRFLTCVSVCRLYTESFSVGVWRIFFCKLLCGNMRYHRVCLCKCMREHYSSSAENKEFCYVWTYSLSQNNLQHLLPLLFVLLSLCGHSRVCHRRGPGREARAVILSVRSLLKSNPPPPLFFFLATEKTVNEWIAPLCVSPCTWLCACEEDM